MKYQVQSEVDSFNPKPRVKIYTHLASVGGWRRLVGLGWLVSKQIVTQHFGRISAASKRGGHYFPEFAVPTNQQESRTTLLTDIFPRLGSCLWSGLRQPLEICIAKAKYSRYTTYCTTLYCTASLYEPLRARSCSLQTYIYDLIHPRQA
jgi:hypothetical protein